MCVFWVFLKLILFVFLRVDLLKRLTHPNIVGYRESFMHRQKDSLCIVMEYCDGGDLCAKIKAQKGKLFPETNILHWFVQMALGLHYMHEERVLHRDLKSQVLIVYYLLLCNYYWLCILNIYFILICLLFASNLN